MIRHSMTEAIAQPEEADLLWAMELFEKRMRFANYNRKLCLQYHSTVPEEHDRLVRFFGGGVYRIEGSKTFRWQTNPAHTLAFIDHVLPYCTSIGKIRVQAFVQAEDKRESRNKEKLLERDKRMIARLEEAQGVSEERDDKPV